MRTYKQQFCETCTKRTCWISWLVCNMSNPCSVRNLTHSRCGRVGFPQTILWGRKKFPTQFCSIEQPTLCFSFVSPLRASYWRNNVGNTRPPANKPETFPKAKWRKECFGIFTWAVLVMSVSCHEHFHIRNFAMMNFFFERSVWTNRQFLLAHDVTRH